MFLLSRLQGLNSQYATARKLLLSAHQIDPEDPEIRAAWIKTLPAAQRIPETEAYLAAPRADTADDRRDMQTDLEELKAWAAEPRKPCTMISTATIAEIPFVPILTNSEHTIGYGLDVKINNHTARIAIDTGYNARIAVDGVSGLLINRLVAQRSGVKPLFHNDVAGSGGDAPRAGYIAYADSLSIGDIEFHDCAVQVMASNFANGADGVFSMDLLSSFLVTLDYPTKRLLLGPLPPRPTTIPQSNGLYNRYVAPEMSDYTPILRSGSDLILPLSVNGKRPMLFGVYTGILESVMSPGAAFEIAKGHNDPRYELRGSSGKLPLSFPMGNVVLSLGALSWGESSFANFDTFRFTDDVGAEISGMIGLRTLSRMTLHIDYRDGLVKFDYDPKRKSPLLF